MRRLIVLLISMLILSGCNTILPGNSDIQTTSSEDKSQMEIQFMADDVMIITENGDLWLWGGNELGEIGNGTEQRTDIPQKVMDSVANVDFGGFVLVVKKNGELWTWGPNNDGELGDGTRESKRIPQKIMDGVKDAKQGTANALALKENGEVWAWGSNWYGFLANNSCLVSDTPVYVMNDVKSIYTCGDTAYAIKNNGELWAWGGNGYNLISQGLDLVVRSPVKIMDDVKNVISCSQYDAVYVIKQNGDLWGWGNIYYNLKGNDISEDYFQPVKILDHVEDLKSGGTGCLALKENGELWVWGQSAAMSVDKKSTIEKPRKIMDDVQSIDYNSFIKNNGELWKCAVSQKDGKNELITEKIMDGIKMGALNLDYSIALTTDNKLIMWDNDSLIPKEIILGSNNPVPLYE